MFPYSIQTFMGQCQAQIFFHVYIQRKMQSGNASLFAFKRKKVCSFPSLYIHSCILAKTNFINQSINIFTVGFRHGVLEGCFNTNTKPKIQLLTMRTWKDSELVSILIFIQTNGTYIVFISYST